MFNPYKMTVDELTRQIKYEENNLTYYMRNASASRKAQRRKEIKWLRIIRSEKANA